MLLNWTKCQMRLQGDSLSWPPRNMSSQWGLQKVNISMPEFCSSNEVFGPYVLPMYSIFDESIFACNQLKSEMFIYTDKVSKFLKKAMVGDLDYLWTGHVRNSTSGEFLSYQKLPTGNNISSTNFVWHSGHPIGQLANCSVVHPDYKDSIGDTGTVTYNNF